MSYASKDKSVHDSQPVECFFFYSLSREWTYTSSKSDVTITIDSIDVVFTPFQITRTALEISSTIDSVVSMDFTVPADSELAQKYAFSESPKNLNVVVYRKHEGDASTDWKIQWQGKIAGVRAQGDMVSLMMQSILQTELGGLISSVYYQKRCNHKLFDARCKINRASFTQTATVVQVDGAVIGVNNMVYPNGELNNGEMTNDRTGEVQSILVANSNIIRVGSVFDDIVVGDTVKLTLGCDLARLGHCSSRYNNTANYGGFDFISDKDPFKHLSYYTYVGTTTNIRKDQEAQQVRLPSPSARRG